MSRAVLRVGVEGAADLRRAFSAIETSVVRLNRAMAVSSNSYRQLFRRSMQEITRDAAQAAHTIGQLSRAMADTRRQAERGVTVAATTESRSRVRVVERETAERERAGRRGVNAWRQVEREMTRISEQGARDRQRAFDRQQRDALRQAGLLRPGQTLGRWEDDIMGRGAGGRARPGGWSFDFRSLFTRFQFDFTRAIGSAISGLHSSMQGAREERARAASSLYTLGRQTGATAPETQGYERRFREFSELHGVPLSELTGAAERVQTQFSSLAHADPRERAARMQRFLDTAQLATEYSGPQAVGEVTRVAGLLQNVGGSPAQQRRTLLSMMRLGELGAVELSSVSREAMQPMMRRVAIAQGRLGPGATAAQRATAGHQAMMQAMAETEVGAMAGIGPRRGANVAAAMTTMLASTARQERIRTNILNAPGLADARRREIEGALFENDPSRRGHRRLRAGLAGNFIAFASAAGRAMGDSPDLLANIFAGTGRGNPQAMQANWRDFTSSLLGTNERGVHGYERVGMMLNEAQAPVQEAEMQRRRGLQQADPLTQIVQNEERRANALTDNTNALVNLSNRVADLSAQHPILSQALTSLASAIGVAGVMRAGNFAAAPAAAATAAPTLAAGLGGAGAAAGRTALTVGAAGAGTVAAVGIGSLLTGLGIGEGINQIANRYTGTGASAERAGLTTIFSTRFWGNAFREVRDLVTGGPVQQGTAPAANQGRPGQPPVTPQQLQAATREGTREGMRGVTVNVTVNAHQQAQNQSAQRTEPALPMPPPPAGARDL